MRIDEILPTIQNEELRRALVAVREDLQPSIVRIRPIREVTQRAMEEAIRACLGDRKQAARLLEISEATIYRHCPCRPTLERPLVRNSAPTP